MSEQVQIKIIELAWRFAEGADKRAGPFMSKNLLEVFDHAYKALVKTVTTA